MHSHARVPWFAIPLVAVLLIPLMTHAASVLWSDNLNVHISFSGVDSIGALVINGMQASVGYYADVINKDTGQPLGTSSTVPYGARLSFKFLPHKNSHIFWSTSGNFQDTPNGTWINGADRPGDLCSRSDNIIANAAGWSGIIAGKKKKGQRVYWDGYAHYVVSPPSKQISGLSGLSCDGSSSAMDCTMNKAGTYTVDFNFDSAGGRLWAGGGERGKDCEMTGADSASVPAQRITYTITVEPEEKENDSPSSPAAAPALGVGGSCIVGEPFLISMTSTDPDGDQLRYLVDWDADGSTDQIVPPTGYVLSGTTQTASRTYSIPGSKTVKVRAEDEAGALSDWSTLSFTCTEAPLPETQCTDGIDNDGDGKIDAADPDCTASGGVSEFTFGPPPPPPPPGPADISIRAVPSLVRPNTTTRVFWSSSNVSSCVVTGNNGDNWTGLASLLSGNLSSPITKRTIYTLACIDLTGETVTKTATVNIVPTWREI